VELERRSDPEARARLWIASFCWQQEALSPVIPANGVSQSAATDQFSRRRQSAMRFDRMVIALLALDWA
jgi:hypothetical protein